MQNELIVFLHNDMDAAGCMLNIEFKYPKLQKKYFFTNYGNLPEKVQEISKYARENGNNRILCADVSFSDNKPSLQILNYICAVGKGKLTIIDHHMYPEDFWDDFSNANIIHDTSKSAALICNEYFCNEGLNANLDKLTQIINIYDLWQDQHRAFEIAQDLNEYFWGYSIELFVKNIMENGWKLPSDYTEFTIKNRKKIEDDIIDLEKRKLIHRFGEITVAMVDSSFNQILIKEMKKGQNFVIGISSYGIIKVRVNQVCGYSDVILNSIRYKLSEIAEYGHLNAFTYKMNTVSFNKLMDEAQRIVETISKEIK